MRNFTRSEANAFLSDSFHTHSGECPDNGETLEFSEVNVDRDDFDLELHFYSYENHIPLDLPAFTYAENETGVLTVRIPYTEDK